MLIDILLTSLSMSHHRSAPRSVLQDSTGVSDCAREASAAPAASFKHAFWVELEMPLLCDSSHRLSVPTTYGDSICLEISTKPLQ